MAEKPKPTPPKRPAPPPKKSPPDTRPPHKQPWWLPPTGPMRG